MEFLPVVFFSFRNELQEEHYNDLRSELFNHILVFSSGPRIVLTRLCIAVSVFTCNYAMLKEELKGARGGIQKILSGLVEVLASYIDTILLRIL